MSEENQKSKPVISPPTTDGEQSGAASCWISYYVPENWDKTCDGGECLCAAYGEFECACEADWTPREVYELREKMNTAIELLKEVYDGHRDKHSAMYYNECEKNGEECMWCENASELLLSNALAETPHNDAK